MNLLTRCAACISARRGRATERDARTLESRPVSTGVGATSGAIPRTGAAREFSVTARPTFCGRPRCGTDSVVTHFLDLRRKPAKFWARFAAAVAGASATTGK